MTITWKEPGPHAPRELRIPASNRKFPGVVGIVVGESPGCWRIAVQVRQPSGRFSTRYTSVRKTQKERA